MPVSTKHSRRAAAGRGPGRRGSALIHTVTAHACKVASDSECRVPPLECLTECGGVVPPASCVHSGGPGPGLRSSPGTSPGAGPVV